MLNINVIVTSSGRHSTSETLGKPGFEAGMDFTPEKMVAW